MTKIIKQYENIRNKINAYRFALFLVNWDSETEAPSGCFINRSKQVGTLNEEIYKLQTAKETSIIINQLYKNRKQLDPILSHEIVEFKRSLNRMKKVPIKEFVEYRKLLAVSPKTWQQAKKTADFSLFQPTLEKIVDYTKRYIKYVETKKNQGYDILLDEYERGYKTKDYDLFFSELKDELVPFIQKVTAKSLEYNDAFVNQTYPIEKQKEFVKYLETVMQYDTTRGLMKESEHPFTSGFGPADVRYTNHFHEDNLISALFSAIHELGHAIYEQQVNPELENTLLWGGGSMALHESQSRFFENIIGRSRGFWKHHFPRLKNTFKKQFKGIKAKDFYQYINLVKPSLIRTEADELTYPIHIMIRYDIEKDLFTNQIQVKDIPAIWNVKVKEYLGIEVPNDREGVLQDIHWACGMFGYFPTYALGSAYAAQIFRTMNKDFKVLKSLKNKNTEEVNYWLKINLHQYGATMKPKVLFKTVARGNFNPKYYIRYLIRKYSKLYQLDQ
ncbi:MAG: carboxypeptidase M32 [Bacilli bacterium]|nr:carboxypeptidase M32 [Bacilli bacterium]MDD4076680.1 carboxypeptidase M32 [Bacilli bacterium]MDD4388421.1 carboxypeptidase M32 [Bacilli bacterium]